MSAEGWYFRPMTTMAEKTSSPAERRERGRKLRKEAPRSTMADWTPPTDRRPAVEILAEQETTRVPELVPIRHERMVVSPFTFYRGAAAVFAADVAGTPNSGLNVQLCGDAHLTNFGVFTSPERNLVFDINDFDETNPGPFEWDLQRLAASFEVAGRANGFPEAKRHRILEHLGRTFCSSIAEMAASGYLDVWYDHLTMDEANARWGSKLSPEAMKNLARLLRKARSKNNLRAFSKLVTVVDGVPRFASDPPLFERVEEVLADAEYDQVVDVVTKAFESYRDSLQTDRRLLLDRYRFVDLARKVVGVGSVGTRCWVALMMGRDDDDPLMLQVKEAEASVLEAHTEASEWSTHGQRVVEGQRMIQSASDVFLGWTRSQGVDGRTHDYYFRQLWDGKGSADIDSMQPEQMEVYAKMCAHTLARAHARTGDAAAMSGYLGGGKTIARHLAQFASNYADLNAADYTAFAAAVGR